MADKKVTVQVDIDPDDSKVKAIDAELNRLKQQRLQLKIDANKGELEETETRIKNLKTFLDNVNTGNTQIHIDDEDIEKAEKELEALQSKKLNLQIAVATDELSNAKLQEEALNDTAHVDIEVNDTAVQGAMQNINDGINQTKQGLTELKEGFDSVLEVSGMAEQNKAFLKMNLGAEQANKSLDMINKTAAKMPGDDNTMRSILSSAEALGANLSAADMEQATGAMADYMAGSQKMGKMALETQQDLTKYLLDGNTAELERGSILSAYVDKLKDGNTFQERALLLEQALKDAKYHGISQQDTLLNKQQKYEGALYNAQLAIGDLFNIGMSGFMDFMTGLDEATGGVSSMAVVLATQFGPGLFSSAQGLVSMGSGLTTMSKEFGGIIPMISNFAGKIPLVGGALSSLSLGPVALVIGALVALGVAIYEVGKAFGWWSDVGTMFEALKAGVLALWDAFISNPYVIQVIDLIKQGLTDAWNAISGFGAAIMSAIGGGAGQFDILSFMINNLNMVLTAVGPLIVAAIQTIIQGFRNIYSAAQIIWPYIASAISSAMGTIRSIISGAMSIWTGLQGAWRNLQSTASTVFGAINGIVSGAGSVWNGFKSTVMGAIQPIIDKINDLKNAASGVGDLLHSVGLGGIETPTVSGAGSYYGSTMVSQGNTIIFNMYGDIRDEKTLNDTIEAINSQIQFEALAKGITTNDGSDAI